MNVDHGIWSTLTKIVIGLIVVAALLLIGMCYLPLIQENQRRRALILQLDQQIREAQEKASQKQSQIDALRSDPKTVERLAREQLGYARSNETVIRFETNSVKSADR
jgi:cell division protein FtsB